MSHVSFFGSSQRVFQYGSRSNVYGHRFLFFASDSHRYSFRHVLRYVKWRLFGGGQGPFLVHRGGLVYPFVSRASSPSGGLSYVFASQFSCGFVREVLYSCRVLHTAIGARVPGYRLRVLLRPRRFNFRVLVHLNVFLLGWCVRRDGQYLSLVRPNYVVILRILAKLLPSNVFFSLLLFFFPCRFLVS